MDTKWTTFSRWHTNKHKNVQANLFTRSAERIVCACVRIGFVYLFCGGEGLLLLLIYYPPINIIGRFSMWDRFSMPVEVNIFEKSCVVGLGRSIRLAVAFCARKKVSCRNRLAYVGVAD